MFSLEYIPIDLVGKDYQEIRSNIYYKKIDFGELVSIDFDKSSEERFKDGVILDLFSKDFLIKIKFYLGECKN